MPRTTKRKRGRPIKRRRKARSSVKQIATPIAKHDDKLKMIPKVVYSRLDQQDSLPRPPRVSSVPWEASSIADDKKLKLVPTVVCR